MMYSTAQMADITGFSTRQLDYWAQRGLVVPSVSQAHGSGSRKQYGVDDITPLLFIRKLKDYGWSTQKILKAISALREVMADPNPLRKALLFDGKGTILALYKTNAEERVVVDILSSGGQQILEIVLQTLIEEAQQIAFGLDQQNTAPNTAFERSSVASELRS